MRRRRAVHDTDVDELEDHLRATVAELAEAGLRPEEAFLVAVLRMGNLDALSREFARVHSERLWKQLVLAEAPDTTAPAGSRRDQLVMAGCAAAAAIGIKLPVLFGRDLAGDDGFYLLNMSLFALVPLAAYFALRRRVGTGVIGVLLALSHSAGSPPTPTPCPRIHSPLCSPHSTCRWPCGWWWGSPTSAANGAPTAGGWTSSGSPANG